MVTASDMRMHHVSIILTLTFVQGHTDLNKNKIKSSIISEAFLGMLIKFAAQIVRQKVYNITLAFIQGHNCVSNLTIFLLVL